MTKRKNAAADVADMLSDIKPPAKQNIVAANKPLSERIIAFLDLKAADDDRVKGITLRWFYLNKLQEPFAGPKTIDTVRKYVRDVLKRDAETGQPLAS